jgi:hypothetical protein
MENKIIDELLNLLTEEQLKTDIIEIPNAELSEDLEQFFGENPSMDYSYEVKNEQKFGVWQEKGGNLTLWDYSTANEEWIIRLWNIRKARGEK